MNRSNDKYFSVQEVRRNIAQSTRVENNPLYGICNGFVPSALPSVDDSIVRKNSTSSSLSRSSSKKRTPLSITDLDELLDELSVVQSKYTSTVFPEVNIAASLILPSKRSSLKKSLADPIEMDDYVPCNYVNCEFQHFNDKSNKPVTNTTTADETIVTPAACKTVSTTAIAIPSVLEDDAYMPMKSSPMGMIHAAAEQMVFKSSLPPVPLLPFLPTFFESMESAEWIRARGDVPKTSVVKKSQSYSGKDSNPEYELDAKSISVPSTPRTIRAILKKSNNVSTKKRVSFSDSVTHYHIDRLKSSSFRAASSHGKLKNSFDAPRRLRRRCSTDDNTEHSNINNESDDLNTNEPDRNDNTRTDNHNDDDDNDVIKNDWDNKNDRDNNKNDRDNNGIDIDKYELQYRGDREKRNGFIALNGYNEDKKNVNSDNNDDDDENDDRCLSPSPSDSLVSSVSLSLSPSLTMSTSPSLKQDDLSLSSFKSLSFIRDAETERKNYIKNSLNFTRSRYNSNIVSSPLTTRWRSPGFLSTLYSGLSGEVVKVGRTK